MVAEVEEGGDGEGRGGGHFGIGSAGRGGIGEYAEGTGSYLRLEELRMAI
jgi:hypothetical protein